MIFYLTFLCACCTVIADWGGVPHALFLAVERLLFFQGEVVAANDRSCALECWLVDKVLNTASFVDSKVMCVILLV